MMAEFILDAQIEFSAAREALAELMQVPVRSVRMVDIHDSVRHPPNQPPRVLAEVVQIGGAYPVMLKISASPDIREVTELDLARGLCRALHASALVSDGSMDPYTMLLVDRRGDVVRVGLDSDVLDQDGRYRVASE